jgi:Sulfotransferase family
MARSHTIQLVREKFPHLDVRTIAHRLSYGSFVSLEHKILYLETPKAACTTVKSLLRDLCGAPPIEYPVGPQRESRRDMFIHIRSNVPVPSLLDLDEQTQRYVLTAPDFLRFSIVRNPYTRLVSAWRNKIMLCEPGYEHIYRKLMGDIPALHHKKILAFEQFLRFIENEPDLRSCNGHWRRQVDLLFYPAIPYTHIGKLEQLPMTMDLIGKHLGAAKPLPVGRSNSTGAGGRDPIDAATAARIYALYAQDFEAFGYDRQSWQNISDSRNDPAVVPESRFIDEIMERNLIISYLYEQYAEVEARYRDCYRLSLARARNRLSRVWDAVRRPSKVTAR